MNKLSKTCPYLGLIDDPSTHMSFPSDWNSCHRAKPIEAIQITHQLAFCLTEKHKDCPVFKRKKTTSLPVELRASDRRFIRKKNFKWGILFAGTLVIVVSAVIVTVIISKRQINLFSLFQASPTATIPLATATGTTTQTPTIRPTKTEIPFEALLSEEERLTWVAMTSMAQTLSPEPSLTITPTSTYTLTPTSTATSEPSQYGLDTPIGTDHQFIIHKTQGGESLNQYAIIYNTSVEAILRANYSLITPLWVDALVVIPVEFTEVTQMPYFQPYKVTTDGITVETLGNELATNLDDFIYYNGLSIGERLSFGDWLLVPRYQSAN